MQNNKKMSYPDVAGKRKSTPNCLVGDADFKGSLEKVAKMTGLAAHPDSLVTLRALDKVLAQLTMLRETEMGEPMVEGEKAIPSRYQSHYSI